MSKGAVLVVDDEAQIRDILRFYLERAGYRVLSAENGRMAMEEMAKIQPDLIVSDLRMPVMGGDELCRHVKGEPSTRDTYFMLVSSMGGSTEREGSVTRIGALNMGADDFIAKPFHAQEVLAKVDSAFRIISMQKEIKRQNRELTSFQERIQGELSLAARLQMGMLPRLPGMAQGFRYTHRYLPAEGIGGDIYTVIPLSDGALALILADVSGHGVAAALISAMVKTTFESHVRLGGGPLDWARGMNVDLARNTLVEHFATAFLARLDPSKNEIRYVEAGHEHPFRIPGGASGGLRRPEPLRGTGFMLGIDEDLDFEEREAPFLVGDRLVLYTDGLVEVEREDRRLLGGEGLAGFCAELPADADEAAGLLVEKASAFNHPAPFVDDVTLVILDRV